MRDALRADLATRFVQYAAEAPEVVGKQGQDGADRNASSSKMDDESVVVTVEVRRSLT